MVEKQQATGYTYTSSIYSTTHCIPRMRATGCSSGNGGAISRRAFCFIASAEDDRSLP